ncbi:MAG: hypothetical protein HQL54_03815 [Magnetococcales bacterium]|nr:hypothetical protein [Magnetococcales bacterium]
MMQAKQHLAVGMIGALPILMWSSSTEAAVFIAASVLIDSDHILFQWFHSRKITPLNHLIKSYVTWDYFGPRILIFHNYETLVFLACYAVYSEIFLFYYVFLAVFLHLFLDQIGNYLTFRVFRIRTLLGDIVRYQRYLSARNAGKEREFLIARRDSWINYVLGRFSDKNLDEKSPYLGGIQLTYPEQPINKSKKDSEWQDFF